MKAYELLTQIKDICLLTGTSRDNSLLQKLNMVESGLYNQDFHWRSLEARVDLYTTKLLTLNVAPSTAWAVGDTITGATSAVTSVIVDVLSTTTFNVKSLSGSYTLGEILSNGTYTADQGALFPTTSSNNYTNLAADVGIIFTLRQVSSSPYAKVSYITPHKFHRLVPQPTVYAENQPTYYSWFAEKLWWYPIPDATYTMTMWYYKKPTGLKIYTAGTAAVSGTAVTGTTTYWSNNANVVAGQYFAFTADVQQDGTYPWALIKTVTDNDSIVLDAAYTGVTATGAYAITSNTTFSREFDPYLIYTTALLEAGRNRELKEAAGWLKSQSDEQMRGLLLNQTSLPDFIDGTEDFAREPALLGDDYAKFPFISGNP